MSGHRKWSELRDRHLQTEEARASYAEAGRQLDMELGRSLKRWQTPAECIKEVIADSNHSRDWWAVELGYHRETLGRICRGQQRVSAEFAVRFENAVRYVKARHLLYLQAEMELRDYLQNETERRRA